MQFSTDSNEKNTVRTGMKKERGREAGRVALMLRTAFPSRRLVGLFFFFLIDKSYSHITATDTTLAPFPVAKT